MSFRHFFLRFMLVSLAATAIIGVAVVLLDLEEFGSRAVGTALATTVASGLLARLAILQERENTQTAGLFGMVVVLFAYVLVVPLIWWIPASEFREEIYEGLWLMVLWILLVGSFLFLCLLASQVSELRWAARVGMLLSLVALVELVVGTWASDPDSLDPVERGDQRWLEAAGATALFGILAVACIPRLLARYWPGLGIAAAMVGWCVATFAAFQEPTPNVSETILAITGGIAGVTAYINLLVFLPLPPGMEWVRGVAISSAVLTMIGVDFMVIHDIWNFKEYPWHEWVGRSTAAAAIVTGCDTVALLVLAIIQRLSGTEGVNAKYEKLALTCPQCETQQAVPLGKSECYQCQLQFSIEVFHKQTG